MNKKKKNIRRKKKLNENKNNSHRGLIKFPLYVLRYALKKLECCLSQQDACSRAGKQTASSDKWAYKYI